MTRFGSTLREAREAKGLTISQLAESTHIMPQIIDGLEKEDFSRIVAPIYGRGFVKLYCEHVGLDSKELVKAFMDILNGTAQDVQPTPPPPAATAPAASTSPEEITAEESITPPVTGIPPIASPTPGDSRATATTQDQETGSPFDYDDGILPPPKKPVREYRLPGHEDFSSMHVPQSYMRFGILAVAAIAIVILLVIGTRKLYRISMGISDDSPSAEVTKPAELTKPAEAPESAATKPATPAKKQAVPAKAPTKPRHPRPVPPLYLD